MSGDGTKEVLVSEEELRSLKCCLCKRLRSAGRPLTPHLTASIERALKEGVSSSFIVFAPKTAVVSEGERIIQAVRGYGERLRLVRLRGAVFGRDEKALVSIADQLVALLDSGDAVESLQALEHFLLSSQATPTVLLLEDVQEFCRRDRQFLLYSLLDLMHSKAVNFVFVGLTHNVQVQELLEKRVSSRLNASYVYVSRSSAEEVLSCLKQTLRIEDEMEEKEMNKSEVKSKRRRQEEEEANCNFGI